MVNVWLASFLLLVAMVFGFVAGRTLTLLELAERELMLKLKHKQMSLAEAIAWIERESAKGK